MTQALISRARSLNWGRTVGLLLIMALLMPAISMAPAAVSAHPPAVRAQPALLAMAAEHPEDTVGIIVQKAVKDSSVENLVTRLGGEVTRDLPIINAFAAQMPAGAVLELARSAGVRWVSLDAPMVKTGAPSDETVTVRDEFNTVSYGNSDGIIRWTGEWVEIGESDGPEAGDVRVTTYLAGTGQGLRIQNGARGAQRAVDLSGAMAAVLSFEYRRKGFETGQYVAVEISGDGGASWVELDRLAGPATDPDLQSASYDISSHASGKTTIRFISSSSLGKNSKLYIDNFQVKCRLAGGSAKAFDAAQGESILHGQHNDNSGGTWTVRDEFNTVSYGNNDGSVNWSTDWFEANDDNSPGSGEVRVESREKCPSPNDQCLKVKTKDGDGHYIWREANLSGATSATLTYDYSSELKGHAQVELQVSSNGGGSWTTLRTYTGSGGVGSETIDITSFIAPDTRIRFFVAHRGDKHIRIDNVQIAFVCTECVDTSQLLNAYISAIGADRLWNAVPYLQGQGITVAVVDSGIANHADLNETVAGGNSRVVVHEQFNGGLPDDAYGHGTHVAGIIGGNGAQSGGAYIGVVPQVNVVDVKVIDDQGAGSTSDVIEGLQWVLDHKDAYNIRVVNLSLNSSVPESYHASPLDAAVEILWFNRIVVVVSAGNNGSGPDNGVLYPPANDPFVITVGATDDMGTADISDDVLAPFSAYGTTADGFAKPDLVAPGTDIISLLASDDCNLVLAHPAHAVPDPAGNYYFRMSGTSMASAVTTGAVALLLQDEPDLTPDQVKYRLKATARPFAGPEPGATGAGYLDIYAAVHGTTTETANTGTEASQLLWTGPDPVNWGSVNWGWVNWGSVNWGSVNWGSVNWGSVNWGSVHWDD